MTDIRASGSHVYTPSGVRTLTNYIINNVTDERIVFYTLPDDISESYNASWESTEVRGRSAPYQGFSGNDARTVSYSFTLYEDLCGDNYMNIIKALKKLVYPRYNGSLITPPYCTIKLGDMVDRMTAVVGSVSVSWGGTLIEEKNHYSKADISLEFTQVILRGQSIPSVDFLK